MYWQQLANRLLLGIDDYEVFSDISSKVWNTGRVLFHFLVKGRHKKGYTDLALLLSSLLNGSEKQTRFNPGSGLTVKSVSDIGVEFCSLRVCLFQIKLSLKLYISKLFVYFIFLLFILFYEDRNGN